MSSTLRVRGRASGLTVGEILVSLALLGAVSLVVIGLFTRLLATSAKSQDQMAANILARGLLEQTVRRGPDGSENFTLPEETTILATNDESTKVEYRYEVSSRVVATDPDSDMGTLYEVTVSVSWWDESSKGHGRLQTSASRMVYVRG